MTQKTIQKSFSAFTLIELLVVVAIIGILASIAVPTYQQAIIKSRVAQVKMELRSLGGALETYRLDHNFYPRKQSDLLFFAHYLIPELTSPIAYLHPVRVKDPFGPVAEFEPIRVDDSFAPEMVKNVPLVKNSYLYVPYISFAKIHGLKAFSKESYVIASVGPDQMDSYIVDTPFPNLFRYPGDSIYHPSNGIVSLGDIGWFGGQLPLSGLVGG